MRHPGHDLATKTARSRQRRESGQTNRRHQDTQNDTITESRRTALKQSEAPTKAFQKTIHRKSYREIIRRNYRFFKQTRLQPVTIPVDGDHHFGDIRRSPKQSCRLFFQNVGGFPSSETSRLTSFQEIQSFSASCIGLQEKKLNETHSGMMTKTKKVIIKQLNARSVMKSNDDYFTESHPKPGGVETILRNGFTSKKNTVWTDPTTLIQRTRILTEDVKMIIINIYLPRPDTGTMATYN